MGGPVDPGGDALLDLLSELERLGAAEDRGRRIHLLSRALEAPQPEEGPLAGREDWRRLRGALLYELGAAFSEEAAAGRSERADDAVRVLTEAVPLLGDEPRLRADALRLLGIAALERRGGLRSESVERAIEALEEARGLAEPGSVEQADLDRLLAIAYLARPAGDREENVERALERAEGTLEVLDRDREPLLWASATFLLGDAYRARTRGDERQNLERAVHCFQGAAEVKLRLGGSAERAEVEAALFESRHELGRLILERTLPDLEREIERSERGDRDLDRRIERHVRDLEHDVPADLLAERTIAGRPAPWELPRLRRPRTGARGAGRFDAELGVAPERAPQRVAAEFDRALREIEHGRDAAEEELRPKRWVGTGFAPADAPGEALPVTHPLPGGIRCLFWFEIDDRPVDGAIESEPSRLRGDLPAEAELDVVLFGFPGGLEVAGGEDVGRLRLTAEAAEVLRQPGGRRPAPAAEVERRRLLFPVRTPAKAGPARLRCNLYHRGLLLQSRLVTAWVAEAPPAGESALAADVDFNLSGSLDPAGLADHGDVSLALMLNDDGDGVHGLRLWGGDEVKLESSIGEGALDDLVEQARGALRRASWGSELEWDDPGDAGAAAAPRTYRYHQRLPPEGLRDDLVRLAVRGYRFYTSAVADLAGDGEAARALGERLRAPGRVQIVERRRTGRAPVVMPAALFYDFVGFDTNLPWPEYRLCPDFERALADRRDLASTPCFQGSCPVRDDVRRVESTVCPSGFWGFRHALGLPASLSEAGEAPPYIQYDESPELTVGVSLDPDFKLRDAHELLLRGLRDGLGWRRGASRREVLDLLRTTAPHLVYFYCHGGLDGSLPFLLVGPPGERGITPDNLFVVHWERPRPLVFLNGCHTAALSPRRAFRFVDALVKSSRAAGVIGTEITVFEELARDFAEACLRRFLVEELPIGEAVRLARLDLLSRGNPLGLVYVPYALPGLRLRCTSAGSMEGR